MQVVDCQNRDHQVRGSSGLNDGKVNRGMNKHGEERQGEEHEGKEVEENQQGGTVGG